MCASESGSEARTVRSIVVRHASHILLRLILATIIVVALPYSVETWGRLGPREGSNYVSLLRTFLSTGLAFGGIYWILGTIAQIGARKRRARTTVVADLVLFCVFLSLMVYAGATASLEWRQYFRTNSTAEPPRPAWLIPPR
jgi:hypothetical protein